MYKTKKQLKQEIQKLKNELNNEKQEKIEILRNREINMEMYNFIKAILLTIRKEELEIDMNLVREAKKYNLYVQSSYFKDAKKIQLIDKYNVVKPDEFI